MKQQGKTTPANFTIGHATRLIFEMTTPEDDYRPVSVVGSFNNWNLDSGVVELERIREGFYRGSILFPHKNNILLEYKYIKGGWDDLETDAYGNTHQHRTVELTGAEITVKDEVPGWLKKGKYYREELLPKIEILQEEFDIPQLIKTRRITALLPHDYYETDKRYPVLYLQDGQNLFDDFAPFGNWGLDKRLAMMAERAAPQFIVIAIDHAKEKRIAEFTPSYKTRLGVGDGKKYARFLADTLKPFVDKQFRTLPGREFTGIGGSSMGGLVSLYTGFLYPEVYSKLLVFSPSLWVDPDIVTKTAQFGEGSPFKLYLYTGGEEGANLVTQANHFLHTLQGQVKKGWKINVKTSFNPKGKHNEADWGTEFPRGAEWLFSDITNP